MKVKELLSEESKWTTGVLAKNGDGYDCSPTDPDASCFCLLGAIDKCYDGFDSKKDLAIIKLKRAISRHTNAIIVIPMTISTFNDHHASFEDIKKVLEIADI
jgi:hypothetical protein